MGGRGRRRVPRGPEEWGRLLYEPEWARRKRFSQSVDIRWHQAVVNMAGGVLVAVLPILMFPEGLGPLVALPILLGSFLFSSGVAGYVELHRLMPFRIYQAGFTLTDVGRLDGLRARETLVPWSRLHTAKLREWQAPNALVKRSLVLVYSDPSGEEREQPVSGAAVEDPLAVMLALREAAPRKLDESLDPYVGEGWEDRVLSVPREPAPFLLRRPDMPILFILPFAIAMSVMLGFWLDTLSFGVVPAILLVGMPAALVLFMVLMATRNAREVSQRQMSEEARVEGDSLTYPRSMGFRLLLWTRPFLPVEEIEGARLVLEPMSFGHEARLTTVGGEVLRAPVKVFHDLEGREGFEREGIALVNRRPAGASGGPVSETSYWKAIVLLAAMACLTTGVGYMNQRVAWTDVLLDWGMEVCSVVVIVAAMAFLFPLMLITSRKDSKQRRTAKDMEVDERALRIPNAPEGLREVRREEVVSARTYVRWVFAKGVEVETTRGTLDLPLTMGARMLREGYEVEDERGLLQRAVDLERL